MYVSLDPVGESTESPFEGGANDVPISQISRLMAGSSGEMKDTRRALSNLERDGLIERAVLASVSRQPHPRRCR
jgi:predicted membrane chloride channel (bestrophin family)